MTRGHSNKVIGQIGEFLVCAEISRRCNCISTPFAGNVPVFDIIATDESCNSVPIQVKTVDGGNWQFDTSKFLDIHFDESNETQSILDCKVVDYPHLIYAFLWLGHQKKTADRYFFLTHNDFITLLHKNHSAYLQKHNGHRPKNWRSTHCSILISDLIPFEDSWDLIENSLNPSL